MAKPPVLKPREVVALLGKFGFAEVRQRGSHRQFRHKCVADPCVRRMRTKQTVVVHRKVRFAKSASDSRVGAG